jgi:SAM-dependent methyltransferase
MDDSPKLNPRKQQIIDSFERQQVTRSHWWEKARFFHEEDTAYLRYLIPLGLRVLELGCGAGHTLAALAPRHGVGLDLVPKIIKEGRGAFPHLELHAGDIEDEATLAKIEGTFDIVLLVDTLGLLEDCQGLLEKLHRFCTRETRLVIAYYSYLWDPLLKLAETAGWKMKQGPTNVLSSADIEAMAELAGFDLAKSEKRLLMPMRLGGLGRIINRFFSPMPLFRQLSLRHYSVFRSRQHFDNDGLKSVSVVIPACNERGNIEAAIKRMPRFCGDMEVIFVEGHSKDGTADEIKRVKAAYQDWDIKFMTQPGKGKADAVFAAFEAARGDVLMILDADLTMPPELLPKFWTPIRAGHGEFINGSRLVYPVEDQAMRFLNLLANRLFSIVFSWILNQRVTDTLCGTKVIRKSDYLRLKEGRSYFGDFDPFGDFDLIFGASKLNLKIVEVPVRYAARVYGETQISRFRHGVLLLKMVVIAFFKIKAL